MLVDDSIRLPYQRVEDVPAVAQVRAFHLDEAVRDDIHEELSDEHPQQRIVDLHAIGHRPSAIGHRAQGTGHTGHRLQERIVDLTNN